MSADSGPLIPLEQKKIQAGWWRVEGYDVIHKAWPTRAGWTIRFCGEDVWYTNTLAEAKEWIRDQA